MRTSKIVALVATTALLVVGSAIAAMAATNGWVEESGTWKYYKNGEAQTECFAKSGDNWYWLDENGEMATDKLVSYNDNTYYVDENGVMVKNTWKELPNEDDDDFGDTVFYYFQNTGKAYKAGATLAWKTINGKKYTFNDEGKMLFGWIDANGQMQDDSENKAFETGVYYLGAANDGARATSKWVKLYCCDTDIDVDGDQWFYFGANGKKTVDTKAKTVNGKKYAFDDYGVMQAEWVTTAASGSTLSTATGNASRYAWFQDAEKGAKYMNGWFKVVPAEDLNKTDNNNEDAHWYYADGKGGLAKSTIKSIKGKQYAFNEMGEMQTGLQWVTFDGDSYYEFEDVSEKMDAVIEPYGAYDTLAYGSKTGLHFFSDDADNDGSMKTGTIKTTANGEDYTLKLGTKGSTKGVGFTGKDGSYLYVNGYKFVADADAKVQAILWVVDRADGRTYVAHKPVSLQTACATYDPADTDLINHFYVISTSGAIVKSGTKTDADGYKVKIKDSKIVGFYNTNLDKDHQTIWERTI